MTTSTLQYKDNKTVEIEHRVINKLFRRLIIFLFILFVFSFLDRINIGFAGQGSWPDVHNVWPRRDTLLCHVRHVRDPQ